MNDQTETSPLTKTTPGPWHLQGTPCGIRSGLMSPEGPVAFLGITANLQVPNVNLMAAAPDMLLAVCAYHAIDTHHCACDYCADNEPCDLGWALWELADHLTPHAFRRAFGEDVPRDTETRQRICREVVDAHIEWLDHTLGEKTLEELDADERGPIQAYLAAFDVIGSEAPSDIVTLYEDVKDVE